VFLGICLGLIGSQIGTIDRLGREEARFHQIGATGLGNGTILNSNLHLVLVDTSRGIVLIVYRVNWIKDYILSRSLGNDEKQNRISSLENVLKDVIGIGTYECKHSIFTQTSCPSRLKYTIWNQIRASNKDERLLSTHAVEVSRHPLRGNYLSRDMMS